MFSPRPNALIPPRFRYNKKVSKKPKLVLVDGNALFHRAYHAIPHLTNADGLPTNAVYGFATILLKMLADIKPEYVIVAWDKSSKTFRKDIYPEYKATRTKQPDDLYAQIPMVRELVEALGIPFSETDDYEADDVIGTLAAQANNVDTIIVTGDRDELQLVDESTVVNLNNPVTGQVVQYDLVKMQEKYGLTPEQFIDYKAIVGDSSDNIPGVPGIGEVGAKKLLAQYGSLDGIYEHLDEIPGKLQDKLRDNKELAYLSHKLSVIVCDVPGIKLDLEAARLGNYDKQHIHDLFRRLSFKSLLAKLPPELSVSAPSLFDEAGGVAPVKEREHINKATYHCVATAKDLGELVTKLSRQAAFAFDTETDSLDVLTANLVGLAFSFKEGEAYYVPVGHSGGLQLLTEDVLAALGPALEDPKIGKVGHNLKFDYQVLRRYGITLAPIVFDTMVAGFIVNPLARSQTLSDLAYNELGLEMIPIEEMIGKGKDQITFDAVTIEDATRYAAEDADVAWRLYRHLLPEFESDSFKKLAEQTEWPLIPVLAEMELAGIGLDTGFLKQFSKTITKRILDLEQEIWKHAGGSFNVSSPSQLQDVLFGKLGLSTQGVKKGKTGYSTAAGELEKLRGQHPIVELLFEYRELMKLKITYVDALPAMVNPADGRVHTSFSQTIAQTGRLSSTNPNLQNIPVRTELGREIRNAFVAPEGRVFVSADYSQIDLRVAAALSKDEDMIETFHQGVDLHQQTAAELYGVKLEDVTKDQRYNAKTINFGVLYGMSPHGLSVATGMTREEAAGFIDRYYQLRQGLAKYIEDTKAFARKNEYTETLFGRRRPCPEINSNNYVVASAAERMAVNVPIQGTSADIIKLAMIALAPKLPEGTDMLLQIHDELIVETDEAQGEAVARLMKETMEGVYDLGVPLVSEANIGHSWGELK